jgi:hypothetical protein
VVLALSVVEGFGGRADPYASSGLQLLERELRPSKKFTFERHHSMKKESPDLEAGELSKCNAGQIIIVVNYAEFKRKKCSGYWYCE